MALFVRSGLIAPEPCALQEHRDGDRQAGGGLVAMGVHFGNSRDLQTIEATFSRWRFGLS